MKKSETEALKKAFNIPEPENKNDFIKLYEEHFKKNKRRFYPIMIFRYASAAVMAAVVICLCGLAGKNTDFNDKFNHLSIIENTKENDSDNSSADSSDATDISNNTQSTSVSSESGNTASTAASSEGNHVTAAPTVQNNEIEGETHEPTDEPTSEMHGNTSEVTTATAAVNSNGSRTTSAPIVTVTTAVTEPPTDATTSKEPENNRPVIDVSEQGKDLTVAPPIKYDKPNDSVYHIVTDSIIVPPGSDDQNSLANNSDCVLIASLDEIIYTEIDGEPYTLENITIIAELKGGGKINYMDKISVFIEGGYMPADKFAENHGWINIPSEYSFIYYSEERIPDQKIGENYIFFLNKGNLIPDEETFIVKAVQ